MESRRSPVRINVKLRKGDLTEFGYRLNGKLKNRREALREAINRYGSLSVLHKLVILRTFNKHREQLYEKLDKDIKWIQREY